MDKVKLRARIILANKSAMVVETTKTKKQLNVVFSENNILKYAKEGDILYGVCNKLDEKTRKFDLNPLVIQTNDKDYLIRNIAEGLRTNPNDNLVQKLYLHFSLSENDIDISDEYEVNGIVINCNRTSYNIDKFVVLNKKEDVKSISDLKYIAGNQLKTFIDWWHENRIVRKFLLLGLSRSDINSLKINIIDAYDVVLNDPITLINISIITISKIVKITGVKISKKELEEGKIARCIYRLNRDGYSGAEYKLLRKNYKIDLYKQALIDKYGIFFDDKYQFAYLKEQYNAEINVANKIKHLICLTDDCGEIDKGKLSKDQIVAIKESLSRYISIINGKAGTGKSTVIKFIVDILNKRNQKVAVGSFTGKAVSRLKKLGLSAKTINLMISSKGIEFDWLIVDEASMLTTKLMSKFLYRYKHNYRIILVGDANQLEPIGPGHLFEQLIMSKKIHISTLKINHRSDDGIVRATDKVLSKRGRLKSDSNFVLIDGSMYDLYKIVDDYKKQGIEYEDIICITPYNEYIDKICSIFKKIYGIDEEKWSLGEKVMVKKNLYRFNLMNGDEGFITQSNKKCINVSFDNKVQTFSFKYSITDPHISCIMPSSCITIHKAQGSEWKVVVVFIPRRKSNPFFVTNKMLYVALTRAQKHLTIICPKGFINKVVNARNDVKNEALHKRI